MTLGITLALTTYALTTKTDFTTMGGALFVVGMGMMLFAFCAAMFGGMTPIINIIYCTCGVILYGFYLIYDIQLLVGGHSNEYGMDEYVIASLQIYLDVIMMFLYILELLNALSGKE